MSTGRGMLELARQRIGERCENVFVPKNNPNWHGPWDCVEFVSWIVFQDAGILYGCLDNSVNPALAAAHIGAWQKDSSERGERIGVTRAAAIPGAILLRFPPVSATMGHIAISDGQCGTIEAKGRAFGVVADTIRFRRWDTGLLIPGVYYDTDKPGFSFEWVTDLYYRGGRSDPAAVRGIQQALLDMQINPGPIDGIYGDKTAAAVAAFQQINGLVVDGEFGIQTTNEFKKQVKGLFSFGGVWIADPDDEGAQTKVRSRVVDREP